MDELAIEKEETAQYDLRGTLLYIEDNHKIRDRLENYFIADELAIGKKEATQFGLFTLGALDVSKKKMTLGLCTSPRVVTIAFALIPDVYLIYFMGIIGSLCLSLLVLIVPGLIPFCTKNYGKIYWMAIVVRVNSTEGDESVCIVHHVQCLLTQCKLHIQPRYKQILWKMASPSHDPLRMNMLPATVVDKRQRGGAEELTESASESERVIEFSSALAYFLKVFMGCGIYAIPAAALISEKHFGISLILGTYVIVAFCLHIVMKNANGCKSYPEFIKKTFDNSYGYFPKASKIFEIFVIIFGFGFSLCICSVYLIFIVTHICKVVYVWHYFNPFEDDANELTKFEFELDAVECRWWIPMAAAVLVILCFLPIWGKIGLYIVALVGAIFQMALIILGFSYTIHNDVNEISVRQSGDLSNLFLVQSIAIYAGEGITTIFPLMAAMREPEKFLGCPSLLCSGMITVTMFAIIVLTVGAEKLHVLLNVYLCFFKRPLLE
uniref:Amino acid transporter transmembrane domain-containing protein n=1 Tax=Glossina pallidipes TaxID=7398 RepID=A0A1A9ZLZ3_GLOPL